jgi:hypothetical protein
MANTAPSLTASNHSHHSLPALANDDNTPAPGQPANHLRGVAWPRPLTTLSPPAVDEPAIGGLTSSKHPLSPSNADPSHPQSASALNRVRGRLLQQQQSPDTLRSASAPNLRASGPDLEIGPIQRTTTQITLNNNNRPVLISKALLEPAKPLGKPPGWKISAINTARYSYLNLLLIFVPVRLRSHLWGERDGATGGVAPRVYRLRGS